MIRECQGKNSGLFLCQRCGWCCVNLAVPVKKTGGIGWTNDHNGKRYGIIWPFEKERFLRDLRTIGFYEDLPVFEFWVDSRQKLAIVCSYMFPKERCHFIDEAQHLCSIYEKRPLVCRIFPITSYDMKSEVCVDTSNCPESRRIFSSVSNEGVVKCPEGTTFGSIFGDHLYCAIFAATLNEFVNTYVEFLGRSSKVRLLPFKPSDVKRILAGEGFTNVDNNALYEHMELRSYAEDVLSLFRRVLERQLDEARSQGFKVLKTAEQVVKDIRDAFQH